MTPEAIAATLQGLRRAARDLRRRPARPVVEALAGVLDRWRDAGSEARRQLATELPAATGFSPEMVRAGLAHSLEPLSGAALEALVDRELGGIAALDGSGSVRITGFETIAVLLAGALPTPTLVALLVPLVLRSGVLAKPAAHDPVTAGVLKRSVAEADEQLAACLELASMAGSDQQSIEALLEADCIVATGSDETVGSVARRVRPPRRLVTHGHRVSVAAVGPDACRTGAVEACARALAVDVALWDQLGCLSPVAVFASGEPRDVDRLGDELAAALEAAEVRWPRGRIDRATAAAIAHEREEAEFRAAAGRPVRTLGSRELRWTVIREEDALLRPCPLHRFVRVHPIGDVAQLLDALRPLGPHLAGVAVCGFGSEQPSVARALADLGASRVCPPGSLQQPPLGWHHDNLGVLLPLARVCDLEA